MTNKTTAHTQGAAAALLKTPTKEFHMPATQDHHAEAWAACLLFEGAALPDGMTTSRAERLPGVYQTPAAAMAAAMAAIELRPDAVGATAKRLLG